MSVLLETSLGDIVIDLKVQDCPKTCTNFLKLCKIKYYNFSPFYNIQKNFSCQAGDPNYPNGDGGSSVWGVIDQQITGKEESSNKFFEPELDLTTNKHDVRGTVSMPLSGQLAGSQFIITLEDNLGDQLDSKAAVFGHVVEGFDTLEKINNAFCDNKGRPLKDIRIKHTYILEDPFEDPDGLLEPSESPPPTEIQLKTARIGADEEVDENDVDSEEAEKRRREQEARSQALTLEMVGDLPFAEVKPMENVLFVCKLNPVTQDEDLELIFSRFGKIISCEVIRDKTSGESLQYAFIEFERKEDCERAYFKMDGVLIDDSRIHVDFSQSVSRLSDTWRLGTNSRRQAAHGDKFNTRNRNTNRDRSRSRSPNRDYRSRDSERREDQYRKRRNDHDRRRGESDGYERRREESNGYERRREASYGSERRRDYDRDRYDREDRQHSKSRHRR